MRKLHIYVWKTILIACLLSCSVLRIECVENDGETHKVFPSENYSSSHNYEGGGGDLIDESDKNNVENENLILNVKDEIVGVLTELTSKNAGALNDISTDATVVVSLPETVTSELKAEAEKLSATSIPNQVASGNATSAVLEEPPVRASEAETLEQKTAVETDEVKNETASLNETAEEIPSFSEWAQKRMEEAEKENFVNESGNVATNGKSGSGSKLGWKNYASPDCGAKVVAANAEAVSPSSVLSPSREEYKLNVCTNRIWFIVELCEAIQAKKIDIANFELFSSTPKEFTVSIGDRFPSREWTVVGQFTAKDERDVQSFDLNPHLFGRYIKVEVKSHHGSQHYCPISLFRVYGISELEVLQKEELSQLDDDDLDDNDESETDTNGLTKNMLNSATNAVYSMIKKAAEVLGTKSNETDEKNATKFEYSPLINTCSTPSHNVACSNCSDVLFGQVYELISCRYFRVRKLAQLPFVRDSLVNSHVCYGYGIDLNGIRGRTISYKSSRFVKSLFGESVLAAVCNSLAFSENRAVLNDSRKFPNSTSTSNISGDIEQSIDVNVPFNDSETEPTDELELDLTADSYLPKVTTSSGPEQAYHHIKPTKTTTLRDPAESLSSSSETEQFDSHVTKIDGKTSGDDASEADDAKASTPFDAEEAQAVAEPSSEAATELPESIDHMEHFMGDVNGENGPTTASPVSAGNGPADRQKESVFLRLSNRIKALERNVSLSSQYLEELSRRYKKQVEEMQKLEKTIQSMLEERKLMEDKSKQLEERLDLLIMTLEKWPSSIFWCLTTITILCGVCWICGGDRQKNRTDASETVERRKSVDIINVKEKKKTRRPSDQALKIVRSSLIAEERKLSQEKRKRKRSNKGLRRSNSINEFDIKSYSGNGHDNVPSTLNGGNPSFPNKPGDWVEEHRRLLEVVDLDESENSSLEQFGTILEQEIPPYATTATDRRASRISSHYVKPNINGDQDFPPFGGKPKAEYSDDSVRAEKKEVGRRSSLGSKLEEGNRRKEKRSFRSVLKNVFT